MRPLTGILLVALTCGQLFAVDGPRMLEAIRIKENSTTMGKAGELGPYQMMPKTVRDAGGHDYRAAARHLSWLERNLKRAGVEPNPFNLALCWNAGLDRATSGGAKVMSYRYATDVDQLYRLLQPPTISLAKPVRFVLK